MANQIVTYEQPDLPPAGKYTREAKLIVVDDQETLAYADWFLGILKELIDATKAKHKTVTKPLNEAKQAIQDMFNPVLEDMAEAELHIKALIMVYRNQQKQLADAAQAEADRVAREEREQLAKAAQDAAAAGKPELAKVLQDTANVVAPVTVVSTFVAPKGQVFTSTWKARLKTQTHADTVAVAKFVGEHPEHHLLIDINWAEANKLAKSQTTAFNIPGLEAYQEEHMSKRRF